MDDPILTVLPAPQRRVHKMIMSVGGYWTPSAGALRLLEELGELAELWGASRNPAGLAEELADLWIITTCTANQFLLDLSAAADRQQRMGPPATGSGLQDLVFESGRIARLINYYDGPKQPRGLDDWPSLSECIVRFHRHLDSIAVELGIDLSQQVERKLAIAVERDSARFRRREDPSSSQAGRMFASTIRSSLCTYAGKARIWGAPMWDQDLTIEENARRIAPNLKVFCRAAREGLDGYVVANTDVSLYDRARLGAWFHGLLRSLVDEDPCPNPTFTEGPIDRPGWQFTFHNLRLFVSVFSARYPLNHPRHTSRGTYVLFQPEDSFTQHHIGSQFTHANAAKAAIRRRFACAGMYYPAGLIDQRIEALLYILPMSDDDAPVRWWIPLSVVD